jgi:hypothetical protein
MLASTHFVYFQHDSRDGLVGADRSRITASGVTEAGFSAVGRSFGPG